ARHPEVLLNSKVEKAFGIAVEEAHGSPLQGAVVMGFAFGLGALAPILPYLLLPLGVAVYVSVLATARLLFATGVCNPRWTPPGPLGLGTVVDNRTVLLGFETHMRFTVIEWDPPHGVVASISGPLLRSGRVTTELLATSEGTRRVSRFDLEPSVVGILLWPLLGWLVTLDSSVAD